MNHKGKWILLISPAESATNQWEAMLFDSEEELINYKNGADLTKEHYWITAEELSTMLSAMTWDEDEEDNEET